MSDQFFVALIGGSIVIAAVAVIANVLELRAFEKRFGRSTPGKARSGKNV